MSEWRETSRVVPKDDEYVVVRNDHGYAVACKYKESWILSSMEHDDGSQYYDLGYFTHWAEMPDVPKRGSK